MPTSFLQKYGLKLVVAVAVLACIIFLQIIAPVHLNVLLHHAVNKASLDLELSYLFPGIIAVVCFILLAIAPVFSSRFESRFWQKLFLLFIFLAIIAFRWPFLSLGERNVDESQDLAIANTLFQDPAYWRSVDPGSHGPLTELPLMVGKIAGFSLDYGLSKSISLLLTIASACLLYLAFCRIFSVKSARLACIPFVLMHGLTHFWDFLCFNAEGPLIFLLSLALFQLGRIYSNSPKSSSPLQWYLLSFILGSVPYSKLQGVPIALVISLWGFILLWMQQLGRTKKLQLSGWYIFGGLSSSIMVSIYLTITNLWNEFIFRYILQNFLYTKRDNESFTEKVASFFNSFFSENSTNTFFREQFFLIIILGLICLAFCCRLWFVKSQKRNFPFTRYQIISVVFSLIFFLSCIYCTFIPGKLFFHYMMLLFPGISLLLCGLVFIIIKNGNKYLSILLVAGIIFTSSSFAADLEYFDKKLLYFTPHSGYSTNKHPASKVVLDLVSKGDSMVVWGWFYRLHVETELPMGTRTTPMHIFGMPELKEKYLTDFLNEFKKSKPEWFIEAVGNGMEIFKDRKKYGIQACPVVEELVESSYDLIGTIGPIRIFRKKQ